MLSLTKTLLFLTFLLASFALLSNAKPATDGSKNETIVEESKNETTTISNETIVKPKNQSPVEESKNKTISQAVTEGCLAEASLNKTAKDVCAAFDYCCDKRCPKKEGHIRFGFAFCNNPSGNGTLEGSLCTCGPDIDTAGITAFFQKLGLTFVVIAALVVLAILACLCCCFYALCV